MTWQRKRLKNKDVSSHDVMTVIVFPAGLQNAHTLTQQEVVVPIVKF